MNIIMTSVLSNLLDPDLFTGHLHGEITVSGVTDLIIERAGGDNPT